MKEKLKNWEELVNDGDNYGGKGSDMSPWQKIVYENIKDKTILKIQDGYTFVKTGKLEEGHGIQLAELIANFEPLSGVTTLIVTHNDLGPEGARIISESSVLPKITYLHLGSNSLGDEGAEIVAQSELFSEVISLNLECNGITAKGAKALARSPWLTKVESLNMVDNRVGEEGALAIADSDAFSNLTYLHLGGNRVKDPTVKSALKESPKLSKLETLKVF